MESREVAGFRSNRGSPDHGQESEQRAAAGEVGLEGTGGASCVQSIVALCVAGSMVPIGQYMP